ncbi:MAG: hypothetical protein HY216_11420, partial [Candidatus Rokubacteria bacterium]|nr:hypothetical protein [Candidatus Rokubacteria bacterium]
MGFVIGLIAAAVLLVPMAVQAFDITPAVQAELDKQKSALEKVAADPVLVGAVKEQNAKGPIAGMDNAKWKTLRRSDPVVQAFANHPAGQLIKKKIDASGGAFDKAFLN